MHPEPSVPTNGQARRPPRIPSHIAWPAFVVLLLLMSITAIAITVVAATSDGGARIVEDSPYDPQRDR